MSLHSYINSKWSFLFTYLSPLQSPLFLFPFRNFRVPTAHKALTSMLSNRLEKVLILTVDGRTLLGTLLSTDQLTNLVLMDTIERIIRTPDDPEPSSQIDHGLYLIRGDNVVLCGEVDEGIDNDIDWAKVKGEVVRSTKNA